MYYKMAKIEILGIPLSMEEYLQLTEIAWKNKHWNKMPDTDKIKIINKIKNENIEN